MSNVETVRTIYSAFSRGDVATILAFLAEDVEWEYGGGSTDVPWLQPRHGRAGAAAFLQALTALELRKFEVTTVADAGNIVIDLCDIEAVVRANGAVFSETDEAHIWHFNDAGLVTRFRHRADTYLQWLAYHAEGQG
ncbi:MAG: hypothetical protein JWO56_1410 [Acidobacteria bacterium]|nr:hypothetical protein [Acidobacteriota bacterium]